MRLLSVCILMTITITVQAQSSKIVADRIIAIVGDKTILHSDIESLLEDMRRMGEVISDSMRCISIENEIHARILEIEAEKNLIVVTDQEVEAELNEKLNIFLTSSHFMMEKEKIEQIKEQARPAIRERRLRERMLNKIIGDITVTPSEVKDFFDRMTTKSDRLNFRNDYSQIAELVLISKRENAVKAWLKEKAAGYSVIIANDTQQKCASLIKYSILD